MHHREVQSIGDMVCRRASIPAATEAAAVASWPLGPLALALALAILSAMPHVALSQSLTLPPLPSPQMNLTCKNVPFPFGERSSAAYVPGFMVTCGPNNETMLRIGEHIYEIDKVSVPESSITIRAGPIKQVCYDRSGRPKPQITGVVPGPTSLEATPFTFSKRNILVATGCNYRFIANFTSSSGGGDGTPTTTSCGTATCGVSSGTIFNGSCAEININECRDMNNNNCSRDACKNTDGGFTCSCPKNTVGDGYRAGTGCSIDSLPPSDVCAHPERNPCMYPEYCKDEQGVTSCACPEGRNGDGRKKGSGCKRHFPLDTALDCLRIAEETAGALAYLHSTSSTPIIHRDIKSSNILLDENFVAKIADFGASRSVPSNHTHVTTLIQGTIGYLDPEYFQTSQLTEKSDVYSFGVVLAELLTRQKPISVGRPEESCNLAMYIVILLNERRLLQEIEPQILVEAGEEQIYAVAQLSARCLNVKGEERPVMREVASVLHGLRESFDEEQIIRSDESIQIINEQESVHSEARPISSLQSSDETSTTQYSLPSEILSSSHLAR
uniref:Protein kinase domain-containing protein n=1 Tax=Oryza nivara TaxID=4536 RepID=A0A0E0H5F9_ORYNI